MRNVHLKGSMIGKIGKSRLLRTRVENFDDITLSGMEICVFAFLAKIQNGRHILGRGKFFENCQEYIA